MKQNKLKIYGTVLMASVMFLISYACTDQQLTGNGNDQTPDAYATAERDAALAIKLFTKTVGAPIAQATGDEWIGNYQRTNSNTETYTIETKTLAAILADKKCVGICFYYATDFNNQTHIIPIGINDGGKLIHTKSMHTKGGDINSALGQQWIDNYTGSVKAHYWGSTTLTSFINASANTAILATRALNNENKPQLLLSSKGGTGTSSSKGGYLDESSPCPPVCP